MERHQKIKLLILLFLFCSFCLISTVYAEDDEEVNLADFPQKLAEASNVPLFAARLLASGIFLAMFLLPTLILTRNVVGPLFVGFVVLSFCISMGWMPVWLLLIFAMIVALMFSGKMREWLSGGYP